MKRLHFLLVTFVLTVIVSIWQQGNIYRWDIRSISYALLIAMIIEISMIIVEINETWFRYRKPQIIWDIISFIRRKLISYRINKSLNEENQKNMQYQLVVLAIENLRSTDLEKKKSGLQQLYELGKDGNLICKKFIYKSLIDAQRRERNKMFTSMLIDALCDFHKACKNS